MTNAFPIFFVQLADSLELFDERIVSLSVTKHPDGLWSFTISVDTDDHLRDIATRLGADVRVIDEPHFRALVCESRFGDGGTRVHLRVACANHAPVAIPTGAWRPGDGAAA